MATLKSEDILEAIGNMTVLEVSELVKAMEEKFGVSAAAPVAVAAPAAAGAEAAAAAEEQTEFTVVLKSFEDGKKIPVIKEVRAITGLGLKEAKELVEAGDKAVKEAISKEEAQKIKEQLETAGAAVEVGPDDSERGGRDGRITGVYAAGGDAPERAGLFDRLLPHRADDAGGSAHESARLWRDADHRLSGRLEAPQRARVLNSDGGLITVPDPAKASVRALLSIRYPAREGDGSQWSTAS